MSLGMGDGRCSECKYFCNAVQPSEGDKPAHCREAKMWNDEIYAANAG